MKLNLLLPWLVLLAGIVIGFVFTFPKWPPFCYCANNRFIRFESLIYLLLIILSIIRSELSFCTRVASTTVQFTAAVCNVANTIATENESAKRDEIELIVQLSINLKFLFNFSHC